MGKQPIPNIPPKLDGKANPYDTSGKPLYQVLEQTQVIYNGDPLLKTC